MIDGFDPDEWEEILTLMDDLPAMFYGEWGDWEKSILRIAELIEKKRGIENHDRPGQLDRCSSG